jgi:hypothetical protein
MRLRLFLLILLPLAALAQPSSTTATAIKQGAALPGTCKVGQVWFKTTSSVGSYQCTALNSWQQFASGTATGDVLGPGTNSANFIPQWAGANSKTLGNGFGVASGIITFLGTPSSANLLATLTTKTGTGLAVFGTAPTITLANGTGLPISTGVSGLGSGVATALAAATDAAGGFCTVGGTGCPGGGGSPGGMDAQIQFNNSSAFGADATFTWDNTNKCFNVGSSVAAGCGAQSPKPLFYSKGSATNAHALWQIDCTTSIACDAGFALKNSGTYSWGILATAPSASNQFQIQDNIAVTQPLVIQTGSPTGSLLIGPNTVNVLNRLSIGASVDVGLCRGAAGQLNINDGSATCTNLAALAAASMKTGPSAPTCTAGTGGPICLHEGTAVTGEAGADNCYGDSTAHGIICSMNNGSLLPLVQGPASSTSGHCVQFNNATGSLLSDAGAACGSGSGGSAGTVVPKTTNYTLLSTDSGSIFTFNGSSLTATLVATAPTMPWIVGIKNMNASDLTVARNGNTINGGTSNLTLHQYQEVSCESDTVTGSEYKCTTPATGSSTITVTPSSSAQTYSIPSSVALAGSPTTTTQSANDNSTKIATTAYVDGTKCTTTVTTGTSATLSTCFTVNQEATAGTGVTYTLPTAASGLQYCVDNGWNGSAADTGVLTFATSASGQFMVFTDGTLTATGGNVTSGGAARDGACVYGIDSTHWMFLPHSGTWTKH